MNVYFCKNIKNRIYFTLKHKCMVWFIPVGIAVAGGLLLKWGLGGDKKETPKEEPLKIEKKVAIIGQAESGKTELWYALQGKTRPSVVTTSNEPVEGFFLDDTVYIKPTQDIGGNDKYVKFYDKIIDEDTIVFFLLDITKINSGVSSEKQTLSEFQKAYSLKPRKIIILATHSDQYTGTELQGEKLVRDYFAPLERYGIDCVKLEIRLVNLKEVACIVGIKNSIGMSFLRL